MKIKNYIFIGPKLLLFGLFFLSFYSNANSDLINKSKEKKLWEDKNWLKLLHYKENILSSGYESDISSNEFFYASDGRINPKSEFLETLKSIFKNEEKDDNKKLIAVSQLATNG